MSLSLFQWNGHICAVVWWKQPYFQHQENGGDGFGPQVSEGWQPSRHTWQTNKLYVQQQVPWRPPAEFSWSVHQDSVHSRLQQRLTWGVWSGSEDHRFYFARMFCQVWFGNLTVELQAYTSGSDYDEGYAYERTSVPPESVWAVCLKIFKELLPSGRRYRMCQSQLHF